MILGPLTANVIRQFIDLFYLSQ